MNNNTNIKNINNTKRSIIILIIEIIPLWGGWGGREAPGKRCRKGQLWPEMNNNKKYKNNTK